MIDTKKIKQAIKKDIADNYKMLEEKGEDYDEIINSDNSSEFDAGFIAGLERALRHIDNKK